VGSTNLYEMCSGTPKYAGGKLWIPPFAKSAKDGAPVTLLQPEFPILGRAFVCPIKSRGLIAVFS
jgi:hypothetical protein